MARPSRAEMHELAVDRDKCAARCDRNAADGDRAANDPNNSPSTQARAARAAESARNHAREYREEAAALRAGRIPGEDW
ncbi:hypothetical protein SUDANB145_07236 (plasmid) [Streptomyces sp. enrichment culture]|uniref:hypothetical protein n=1 Tax=Streptomyces sp. enrichment culture TaxID=1795815 RepID=UPI003F567FB0